MCAPIEGMTEKRLDEGTTQEIADGAGQPLAGVEALESTGLLPSRDGTFKTAEVLEAMKVRAQLDRDPRVLDHLAGLSLLVRKHDHIIAFLSRLAGLHAVGYELTDEQLQQIYQTSREYETLRRSAAAADWMIDILLAMDDRAIRRMDQLTGERNAWRHLAYWAEGLADFLVARRDRAQDFRIQALRNELCLALTHYKYHAGVALALQYPEEDPHRLLDQLVPQAAQAAPMPHGSRDRRDPTKALLELLEEVHRRVTKLKPA